jgi:hypothetical protein
MPKEVRDGGASIFARTEELAALIAEIEKAASGSRVVFDPSMTEATWELFSRLTVKQLSNVPGESVGVVRDVSVSSGVLVSGGLALATGVGSGVAVSSGVLVSGGIVLGTGVNSRIEIVVPFGGIKNRELFVSLPGALRKPYTEFRVAGRDSVSDLTGPMRGIENRVTGRV